MHEHALAACAAALVSVMAMSGPAKAQVAIGDFYTYACIDSKGKCYTSDGYADPIGNAGEADEAFVNYVNRYQPGTFPPDYRGPPAPGLFGLALEEALATYPAIYNNTGPYAGPYIDEYAGPGAAYVNRYIGGPDRYIGGPAY